MNILIYGPRKSGTTLFQRLLDGGDNLFVHPSETKIKHFISLQKTHPELFAAIDEANIEMYFRTKKKNWEAVENDTYIEYIRERYKLVKSLQDYINLDIEASKAALGKEDITPGNWAIKEVSGNPPKILNAFLDTFQDGKVLMIVRDPRKVTNAVYREKKKTGTHVSLKRGWSISKECYRTLRQMSAFASNERVMIVYFEDLILNTEQKMRDVADFLNISFTKTFLKPTIDGNDCIVPSSSKQTKKVFKREKPLYKGITYWQFMFILIQSILNTGFIKNYNNQSIFKDLP